MDDGVFTAVAVGAMVIGIFLGWVVTDTSFNNRWICTESAIVNGAAECVRYERREK